MRPPGFRIGRLADHQHCVAALAAAYRAEWPQWYGADGPGEAETDLRERANPARLPLGIVALGDEAPIGAAAVSAEDTYGDPDFRPTIIGLWVAPAWRRHGVGRALARAAEGEARALGFRRLHAASSSAAPFFRAIGWAAHGVADWRGETLSLFARDLQDWPTLI